MKKGQLLVALIVIVIAAAVGVYGYRMSSKDTSTSAEALPGKPYEAVFLTNGQVYFGKISGRSSELTTLKDIYYLQVQQPIQPKPEEQQQPQIQLVKLGNELHKPKDEMHINNQQILFTEEMSEDGQVVTAIRRFQSNPAAATAPAPAPAPTAPEAETKKPKTEKKSSEETTESTPATTSNE